MLECSSSGGIVSRDYVARTILKTFMGTHKWRESLEVRFEGGNIRWVNAVAHARKELVREEILKRAEAVPGGGYELLTGAEDMARRQIHEQEVQALRADKEPASVSPKQKRKRAETEVEDSDAVYIMFDPKRPGSARSARAMETAWHDYARRGFGTNGDAELRLVEPVGSGLALKVEFSVRYELSKKYPVSGEWVDCKYSTAVLVLETWGKRAREATRATAG